VIDLHETKTNIIVRHSTKYISPAKVHHFAICLPVCLSHALRWLITGTS